MSAKQTREKTATKESADDGSGTRLAMSWLPKPCHWPTQHHGDYPMHTSYLLHICISLFVNLQRHECLFLSGMYAELEQNFSDMCVSGCLAKFHKGCHSCLLSFVCYNIFILLFVTFAAT